MHRAMNFLKCSPWLPVPTTGRSCPQAGAAAVTLPAGGVAGGAPPAANVNVVVVQQEGWLQEREGSQSWRSLLLLVASTSSTSGDNNNECNDYHNLHQWRIPPTIGPWRCISTHGCTLQCRQQCALRRSGTHLLNQV